MDRASGHVLSPERGEHLERPPDDPKVSVNQQNGDS